MARIPNEEHGSLTPFQLTAVVSGTIVGVGVLVLPRILVEMAGHSAPLAMLVGTLIAMAMVPLWVKIAAMFPGQTVAEYASNLVGKIPAWLLHLTFSPFIAVATAMVAREFGEVVVTAVLVKTPLEVTTMIMLALAIIFVRYDLQVIGRTFEVFFPFMFLPALSIALLSLQRANAIYLLPIWDGTFLGQIGAVAFAVGSLEGMLILPILLPSINRPGQATKAALWAVGLSGFIHIVLVTCSLALFNSQEVQKILWPTFQVARTTAFPGNVLERIEPVFLGIWVIAVFTTIGGWLYTAVIKVTKLLKLQDHKTIVPFLGPLLYAIAMQPDNVVVLYDFLRILVVAGLMFMIGVPILFFAVGKLRGFKEQSP